MRCSKARRQIELKLDNELGQSHALELHLKDCAACRAYQADAARLQMLLRNQPQPEFPSWLHHRIMEQAARHDSKRIRLKHSFNLQTIPALAAIALSLFLGVAIGKNVYRSVKSIPKTPTNPTAWNWPYSAKVPSPATFSKVRKQ